MVYILNAYPIFGGYVVIFVRMTRLVHIVYHEVISFYIYAQIFVRNNLVTVYLKILKHADACIFLKMLQFLNFE